MPASSLLNRSSLNVLKDTFCENCNKVVSCRQIVYKPWPPPCLCRHRRTATGEEHLQSVNMVSIVAELDGCWAAASVGPLPTALHAAAAWQRRQAGCGGGWRLDGAERLLVCRVLRCGGRSFPGEPRVWPACFARLWSCSAARRRLRLSPVPALSTGLIVVVWDSLARAHGLTGRRCPEKKINVQ